MGTIRRCSEVPGFGTAGDTREEIEQLTAEGLAFHLSNLSAEEIPEGIEDGTEVSVGIVEVPLQVAPQS